MLLTALALPVLVLGVDELVHRVDAAARRPLVGPSLVQHALQHRHDLLPRPERPVVIDGCAG
jgi:hypothetical protein